MNAELAEFLADHWGMSVMVDNLTVASAGARRRNVLFDAACDGETVALVMTQIPTAEIQLVEVSFEAACIELARTHGVAAPRVEAVSTDPDHLGGPFFLTRRVPGASIPREILRLCAAHTGLGSRIAEQCGEALARLHSIDIDLAPEGIERPSGSAAEAALAAAEEQIAELLQPSPAFTLAQRWLERRMPPTRELVIAHTDVRNGNIMVDESGLTALLDWELTHLGHPNEDLAWLCQRMWRFGNDHLEVGGFATRADLRRGYERAGGTWDDDTFDWWNVMRTLWWGLGLANKAAQHLDGTFPNIVMAASGRRVAELEYDVLRLIA